MNDVDKFQSYLISENDHGAVLTTIISLARLDDADRICGEVKGFNPIGSWSGWSW